MATVQQFIMRGTTPTHTFVYPFDLEAMQAVVISYMQQNNAIITKRLGDSGLSISGSIATIRLTQQETLLLSAGNATIVTRVKDSSGNVPASDPPIQVIVYNTDGGGIL